MSKIVTLNLSDVIKLELPGGMEYYIYYNAKRKVIVMVKKLPKSFTVKKEAKNLITIK